MKITSQFIVLLLAFLPLTADAQKNENVEQSFGIFETQREYSEFMSAVKTEGRNDPDLMAMVPLINDVVLGQPIGSTGQKYNATGSTIGLLADPDVRKELEMLDEQFESLQKSNSEIRKQFADQLRELDFSDMKTAMAEIMKIREQSEKELQGTLLPHQMDRLRQILAQRQLRSRSLVDIITSEPMRSQLQITDHQSGKLRSAEIKIEEDLEKQIAELRQKARRQLLSSLNGEQRKQIDEIFGSVVDPKDMIKLRK